MCDEASEMFDRGAPDTLLLYRPPGFGSEYGGVCFTVPNQFLQEKYSESDIFGPRAIGRVASDVKSASVVSEECHTVELIFESRLR